ncbi:hypothetical protein DUI87_09915 [Hirundo rustica rustica]|uniref:Uncharacterized protein n=1 Tax=Hirundo rustica rustica TaxID=333673 RepID=A0A3M0KN42_HIRRU|nr:hypothetical protein DUI87_09915 [Hirundo rustica rustica]
MRSRSHMRWERDGNQASKRDFSFDDSVNSDGKFFQLFSSLLLYLFPRQNKDKSWAAVLTWSKLGYSIEWSSKMYYTGHFSKIWKNLDPFVISNSSQIGFSSNLPKFCFEYCEIPEDWKKTVFPVFSKDEHDDLGKYMPVNLTSNWRGVVGNVNTVNMSTISGTDVEDSMRTDFEYHAQTPPGLGAGSTSA